MMIIEFNDQKSLHHFPASGARVYRGLCHWEVRWTRELDLMKPFESLIGLGFIAKRRALVMMRSEPVLGEGIFTVHSWRRVWHLKAER